MQRCFIGLGANTGDPLRQLRGAVSGLRRHPQLHALALSPVYRTAPLGPADQPDYLNAVAGLDTALPADSLLDILQALEQEAGRVRTRRWGPRTLDLDLLLYGDQQIDTPRLHVPHPRLVDRDFVLIPLRDLVGAGFILPGGDRLSQVIALCQGRTLRQAEPEHLLTADPEQHHCEP